MATNPIPAPRPRGDAKMLMLILAIGAQLAFVGAYVGFKTLAGGETVASSSPLAAEAGPRGGLGVGDEVTTSFGSIVVGTAKTLNGVTSKALAGMNHNIGDYVSPEKAQVQVTVVITNRTRKPVAYSPTQFTLRANRQPPVTIDRASIRPATLLPDAAIEATLVFVVPRKGQKLSLAFQEPGRTAPYLVDIGNVDTAPAGTDDDHSTGKKATR